MDNIFAPSKNYLENSHRSCYHWMNQNTDVNLILLKSNKMEVNVTQKTKMECEIKIEFLSKFRCFKFKRSN